MTARPATKVPNSVKSFRADYKSLVAAGYRGSKRELAETVMKAPHLFARRLVTATKGWLEFNPWTS